MINKEALRIFYFLETIDKMYFFPDSSPVRFWINLHINDEDPKNPRIVELFYFPYQKFDFGDLFENLYHVKIHYSSFEMENDGKIYEIIDKSSPELIAQKIISFVDEDLEKARKTVHRNILTLANIYAQTIEGLENMMKAKGKDLRILIKLWFEGSLIETDFDFDLEKFKSHLQYLINQILSLEHKLIKLIFEIEKIQAIAEYTILKEIPKKLYEIRVRFVVNYKKKKNIYAYYNISIDDDKIKVSIEVEYDIKKVVKDIYKRGQLVVRPFNWRETNYREKATNSWYYLLRPEP